MSKPVLLDLFCGAGGAAMGYHRAGFDVVGVDINPQPRYPFTFVQADALTYPLGGFKAIHASPVCKGYSVANNAHKREYPRMIPEVYARLAASGLPFIIENVPTAPMPGAIILCGSMFDLRVIRHRAFWSNMLLFANGPCRHKGTVKGGYYVTVVGHSPQRHQPPAPIAVRKAAMGIEWMNRDELSQAIPPAYTEWLGRQLIEIVRQAA